MTRLLLHFLKEDVRILSPHLQEEILSMDNYFDPVWEQAHPYLAALWKKLLAVPQSGLLAQTDEGLFLYLQSSGPAADRVQLFWGEEGTLLGGLSPTSPFVTDTELSRLFQHAKDKGLPLLIDEQSVPLERWNVA